MKTWSIFLVNDGLEENHETFTVILKNPRNAILGQPTSARVEIIDLRGGEKISNPLNLLRISDGFHYLVLQRTSQVVLVGLGKQMSDKVHLCCQDAVTRTTWTISWLPLFRRRNSQ